MSKTVQAVMANLTFTVGQLEEIKSNINDTLRYIKNNQDTWDTTSDSINESSAEESATEE